MKLWVQLVAMEWGRGKKQSEQSRESVKVRQKEGTKNGDTKMKIRQSAKGRQDEEEAFPK